MKPTPIFLSAASQAAASNDKQQQAPPSAGTSDSRSTEFRAVEGGNQMQSGEKLLVEAYAAMWVLTLVLVLITWRRQKRTDERITNLEESIALVRGEAAKAAREKSAAAKSAKAGKPAGEAGASAGESADA